MTSSEPGQPTARTDAVGNPRLPARVALFLAIVTVGVFADLWTKSVIFAWRGLPGQSDVWWVWPGYVGIQTSLNTGAVFGMMSGWTLFFAILSFAAVGLIAYWVFWLDAATDLWQLVALACVMAGVLGNLHDRLGLWAPTDLPGGYPSNAVRDWILLCYRNLTWPNFNIADSLLVCATSILVWRSWQLDRYAPAQEGVG